MKARLVNDILLELVDQEQARKEKRRPHVHANAIRFSKPVCASYGFRTAGHMYQS